MDPLASGREVGHTIAAVRLMRRGLFGFIAAIATLAPAPVASALNLSALKPDRAGWIALRIDGTAGQTVTLAELVGGAAQPFDTVTLASPSLEIPKALAWRCDRRVRAIVATDATGSSAPLEVRTPSCAGRFTVNIRPRTAVVVGHRLTVDVKDGWRTGLPAARVCLRVRGAPSCRTVAIPARGARLRLPVRRSGVGRLLVTGAGFAVRQRLQVRGRRALLRLLATGDSMIQIIDSLLARRLRHAAHVTSDAHISTGISKSSMLNWVAHARGESAALRPQATVMFIGANDGFPIAGVACCGTRWVHRYAARVRRMMAAYRRGGAGRVYWLTIPTPRDAARKTVYDAVNAAIKRAAARFKPDEVSVIDLVRIFTPGGVFRKSINGRVVRQSDGIHLNTTGAKIAAAAIVRRLRADRLAR